MVWLKLDQPDHFCHPCTVAIIYIAKETKSVLKALPSLLSGVKNKSCLPEIKCSTCTHMYTVVRIYSYIVSLDYSLGQIAFAVF